jgi:hypothetical protein
MKKCIVLIIFFSILGLKHSYGQNEKFKALFIYNFTKYIEWPTTNTDKVFTITVLGDSPIKSELESISQLKKIGNASIEVKTVATIAEIGNAHVIYVPPQKKKFIPDLATQCAGKPILIITDEAQGSFGINFIEIDQKQSFQISKSRIEAHKLKVNSALLSLGIVVN